MLTRAPALQWGANGVRINSIVPGPIAKFRLPIPKASAAWRPARSCCGRWPTGCRSKRMGRLDDIAARALFLSSDAASYVTCAVIPVDGGLALVGPRDFSAAAEATARGRS
jgi:NAD(P)-dependent dehydrogenase (short-subunit alcohol dehydrogenase family)